MEKKRDIAPSEGGSAFASTTRPQSASALTGSEARDGSAALSQGGPDLSRAVTSTTDSFQKNFTATEAAVKSQPIGSNSSNGSNGSPSRSQASDGSSNWRSTRNPGVSLPSNGKTSSRSNKNLADQVAGDKYRKSKARKSQGRDLVTRTLVGSEGVSHVETAKGTADGLSAAKDATEPIRSSLGSDGMAKVARATSVAAALMGGGNFSLEGKGTSLMRPQGPSRPTRASAKEVSAEVVKSAGLAAFGDYGFVGAAARIADQTGIFAGSKARNAVDAIGSSKLGKLAEGLDKGLAQSVLDGGSDGERPSDANMADRMAKQSKRSTRRAVRSGLKVALQGGSALDIAKESAIGAADDETVDNVRSAWQTGKNVKKIAKKGRVLLKKRLDPSFRGVGERIKKNPVSRLSESIKRRYAQGKSRAIKKALSMGKTAQGMTAAQRAQAIIKAATQGFHRVAASIGGMLGGLTAILPAAAPVILIFAIILLLANPGQNSGGGSLDGVALQVYQTMAGLGYSDEVIAAVLGNMQQESGMDPGSDANDGYGNLSLGLLQMMGDEKASYINWCNANGKDRYSVPAQMEWTFGTGSKGYWSTRWEPSGPNTRFRNYTSCAGYEQAFAECDNWSPDQFKNSHDVAKLTYTWMAKYEGPLALSSNALLNNRIQYANDFYAKIKSGAIAGGVTGTGGQEYQAASEAQKRIVDVAKRTASPGAHLCAMWVSRVYSAAGFGYPGGNANNMYDNFCKSSNRDELKVGMLVAVRQHGSTSYGATYGHVGIYIGDGMVMESVTTSDGYGGRVNTQSLDSWIKSYGNQVTPRWGFAANVPTN